LCTGPSAEHGAAREQRFPKVHVILFDPSQAVT
jgi:hypothetical protein